MMDLLRKQYSTATLPYHIVVPSMPGYTFSSRPPLDANFRTWDVARIFNKLVLSLGFGEGYAVQGGDIGSRVARIMGVQYSACKGTFVQDSAFSSVTSACAWTFYGI